jgi:hypothetical protein
MDRTSRADVPVLYHQARCVASCRIGGCPLDRPGGVAAVAAACTGGPRPPAWPGTGGGGHFASPAFTSGAVPPARASASMAYYPPGRKVVLFGGLTPWRHGFQRSLDDTWNFGAEGWRRVFPRHSPSPRDGGLMAYDPATRLLLFGGSSVKGQDSSVLSDAWAWNGMDWRQLTGVRLPTWMPGAPIAWDPAARRVTELAPRPGYPGIPGTRTFTTAPPAAGPAPGCGPGAPGPTTPSARHRGPRAGRWRLIRCRAACCTSATPPRFPATALPRPIRPEPGTRRPGCDTTGASPGNPRPGPPAGWS